MEDQPIIYCTSIFDHSKKIGKSKIQCNVCTTFSSNDKMRVESHLFHKHNIFTTKSEFIWGDQFSTANRFFEPVEKYSAQCKICDLVLKPGGRYELNSHLETHQHILNIIRDEITNDNCVPRHFNMTRCRTKAYCKFEGCKFSCKTVNGINFLRSHLKRHTKRIHSESCTETRSYNVDATIQQPVAEENYASTSHSVRQPDTMAQQVTYCETIRKHCEFIKRQWHCNLCLKKKKETKSKDKIIMEAHLFQEHKKIIRQSNFIWDNNIIKRYFIGVFPNCKYYVKCKKCDYSRAVKSKYDLYNHLTKHEKVLKKIQGEIKNSWVEKHFEMSSSYTKARCTLCHFSCRTVMGIDHLKTHVTRFHKLNEHSKSLKEIRSYNVDATIQQPVAEENYASTSFHHDNRQTFGNQGDEQRYSPSTSTQCSTQICTQIPQYLMSDNLHEVIQQRRETGTSEQMTRPEQETGTAGFNITYAPTTSTQYLMSDDNLHRVTQHGSETETRELMIPPEQGTAGSNIEQEDEMKIIDFETDYSDLLQSSDQ